ncbi:MAG TPA: 2TM domain-containing protein [Hydrogenophaga sp.]|nr:2TM domain-containing protein [Hydrogenophaga sp.]
MNENTLRTDSDLKRLARKRVKARLGWLIHATVYVCVITGLALLGLSQGKPWPIYPALGWGFGLFMHGLVVFVVGAGGALREQWVEREHQRLVRQRTGAAS